jgi:hypothetical protein
MPAKKKKKKPQPAPAAKVSRHATTGVLVRQRWGWWDARRRHLDVGGPGISKRFALDACLAHEKVVRVTVHFDRLQAMLSQEASR